MRLHRRTLDDHPLIESHDYLEVQPADAPLDPDAVYRSIPKLHQSAHRSSAARWPTYEFLFAAQGTSGAAGTRSIEWHVGVHDADLRSTRRALEKSLPHTYDVVETECSYADLLGLPVPDREPSDDLDHTPTDTPATSNRSRHPSPRTASDPDEVVASTTGPERLADTIETLREDLAALRADLAALRRERPAVTDTLTQFRADESADALPTTDDGAFGDAVTKLRQDFATLANRLTPETVYPPVEEPTAEPPLADWRVAGVEFHGQGNRKRDWMLPLRPLDAFDGEDSPATWPLADVLDWLARGDAPALFQVLVRPKPDWTADRDWRATNVRDRRDTPFNRLRWFLGFHDAHYPDEGNDTTSSGQSSHANSAHRDADGRRQSHHGRDGVDPRAPEPVSSSSNSDVTAYQQRRLSRLETVDPRTSFTVNARAVAFGTDRSRPTTTLRPLGDTFDSLVDRFYRVDASWYPFGSADAAALLERLLIRELQPAPTTTRHRLPVTSNTSRAIVADTAAVGALCLTGGQALSSDARRALETTPPEKTGIELPPTRILNRYQDAVGLTLGTPRDANREPIDATASLPPDAQPLHVAVFGGSGSGKSALGQRMLFDNHVATEGASIYLDHKGDGGAEAYLRAHATEYGDLEDVYYFDCEDLLPALPLLSIEPQLEDGVDRLQAVENVVDRFSETLAAYMGEEIYHRAPNSVNLLKAVLKAMFDELHGSDTISILDPLAALYRLAIDGEPPPVSDPLLRERLRNPDLGHDSWDAVLQGALNRLTLPVKDARLTDLFTHAADDTREQWFDLREYLDEQCIIIVDTSGYREDPRRLLTLAVVSELWTALTRRRETADSEEDLPVVNLFLEEAADVATSDVLADLLAQGRAFGVGVTVMMQFPGQVKDSHPRVYRELINDIGTHVTGTVNDPEDLVKPFTTDDRSIEATRNRIADLDRGEWLVRPAAPFADTRPRPFVCESPPLIPGHPAAERSLTDSEQIDYEDRKTLQETRIAIEHGLPVGAGSPSTTEPRDDRSVDERPTASPVTALTAETGVTVPFTRRLPDAVTYLDQPPYPLICSVCETRYFPRQQGMRDAISCCHDVADVDRDEVPVVRVDLPVTPAEQAESDCTAAQLRLLAAVYMGHQQRFDRDLEYDVVRDSMVRLEEYVGIEKDPVRELLDTPFLKRDCTYPYTLYTVTPEGRSEIGVGHREGIAHGDGKGDLDESSLHVAIVEAGSRYFHGWLVEDPHSPAVTVKKYPEVEGGRLDAAAFDGDGNVVAALEVELPDHDIKRAVPDDYDTIAQCDPEHALWIVKNREQAHEVLAALNDPADGDPRIEKRYSQNMPPQDFEFDSPGLTELYTFQHLRDTLLEDLAPPDDW